VRLLLKRFSQTYDSKSNGGIKTTIFVYKFVSSCVIDASVLNGGNLVNVIENLANKANVGKIQKQRDDGIKAQAGTGNARNDKKYGGAMKRMAGFGSFGTSALFNPFAQMNSVDEFS